jgi:L-threonylcarbamoyladenylate synthase
MPVFFVKELLEIIEKLPKDNRGMLPSRMITFSRSKTNMTSVFEQAANLLLDGGIIAYPTETFYGLGARYDNDKALGLLYAMKQRPGEKAMPLIIGSEELLPLITGGVTPAAKTLIRLFWPGPLTLLLTAQRNLSEHITAGTGKVAVRIPGPSFALDLARKLDFPITATSANTSGMPPAETADAVKGYFDGAPDAIIDCGRTRGGSPSTIVDATGSEILIVRQGIISSADILRALSQGHMP